MPRMLTSSIVRMSFGSTSVIRLLISTPALLTRMSSPPKSEAAAVDGVLPARLVGHVEVHEAVAVALERVGDLLPDVVLQVGDHDTGAGGGERLGHALAESLGAPGHEGGASGQVKVGHG